VELLDKVAHGVKKIFTYLNEYILSFKSKNENPYLYHYTSVSSLDKMLPIDDKKPSLLLNHISSMNDINEGNLIYTYLGLNTKEELIESINSDLYLTSFSENREDDLSQWRAYGDNGRGVSLGFQKSFFINELNNIPRSDDLHIPDNLPSTEQKKDKVYPNSYLLGKVIYVDKKEANAEKEDFYSIIKEAKEILEEAKENLDELSESIIKCFRLLVPFIKDSSYKDEQE
jgi:hypothetical protein